MADLFTELTDVSSHTFDFEDFIRSELGLHISRSQGIVEKSVSLFIVTLYVWFTVNK